jgi:hypothetical protein
MGAPRPGAAVVVADDDLFFSARISAALAALGYAPIVVRTVDAFQRELAHTPAAGIVNRNWMKSLGPELEAIVREEAHNAEKICSSGSADTGM